MDVWGNAISAVAASLTGVGLFAGWLKWREVGLRRDDVLSWSNDVISSMQSLLLVCILRDPQLDENGATEKVRDIIFETSILVERGRIFFKNETIDDFGKEKEPAYRGYRPQILDPLVVAHQISCHWLEASEEDRIRLRILAEDSLKKFVSLIQKEIGRGRTAAADTKRGGDGVHLAALMQNVDSRRVDRVRRSKMYR